MPHPAAPAHPAYLVGIDGGGSGTRARVQTPDGQTLGEGRAGPSALGQGIAPAWHQVDVAIGRAFAAAGLPRPPHARVALGLGLAGAGLAERRDAFLARDPGYARVLLCTDAQAQLQGAFGGGVGIVVAAGTGSIALARGADGTVRRAGGWGFPIGDEGGGAWIGRRALQLAQAACDGRSPPGPLAESVLAAVAAGPGAVGPAPGRHAAALAAWSVQAGQAECASLAPRVFAAAEAGDAAAASLLQQAADELARLVVALQPPGALLPVALTGSIGERLLSRWPSALRARCIRPRGDALDGVLALLRAEPASAAGGAGRAADAAAPLQVVPT